MTQEMVKVSVLASGAILLDGSAATLGELEAAFQAAKERGAAVLYYREAAGSEPPAEVQTVLKMIVAQRLPVSMSSKPDFSDWVDQQGVSHPRDGSLPSVTGAAFARARRESVSHRAVAIVRPDRKVLLYPAPPAGSMAATAVKSVEALVPTDAIRNVAVIADSSFARESGKLDIGEIGRVLPFFGFLIGFSYIGHAVWIFDADAEGATLADGCREADLLIVDSAVVRGLPKEWGLASSAVMRNPNIILMDRATQKFLLLRTAGETKGKIEFPKNS